MSRITIIKEEIDTDPETRGYSGMTDQEIADDLNTVYRTRNKSVISGSEAFYLTDSAEYEALTQERKNEWLSLCAILNHDPFGVSQSIAVSIFGGGSNTISALAAFRVENISRGVELNVGTVGVGDIEAAKALP